MRDLWGTTVGLLLSLLFMAALIRIESGAHKNTVQLAVAQQAVEIEKAAAQYMTQYQTQLLAATTPTTAATITVPMLVATNFLPPSAQGTDIYGQTWQVEVLQPTSGNLQGFLITSGGKPLDNLTGVDIAQEIGADGGFYPQPSTVYPAATIMGTGGAWQEPVGHWPITQGQLAVYVDATQNSTSDYLYRNAVPGDPQANTMNTPLVMASVQTPKTACGTTGAIAQDGTGALLSCQSGQWMPVGGGQWKAPVASYGALPGTNNQIGDVRLATDTDRAYAWTGGSWQALAVDQNGDLTVPNTITAGGGNIQLSNAGFGAFLTLVSNTGRHYSFVSQDNYMTLYDSTSGDSVWKAQSNGEWDSDEGGFCFSGNGNTSYDCNSSWGFQPRYGSGWSMVTSVNGSLNAQAGSALGSIHANDYYDRATGWWFSSLVSTVNNQQSQINSEQSQINNINNNLNANVDANCYAAGYTSIVQLCNNYNSLNNSVGGLGNLIAGPIGVYPSCCSYAEAYVGAAPYAQLVVVTGSAGYAYNGNNQWSYPYYCNTSDGNLGNPIYLSGGGQTATAVYSHISYGTAVVYPLSLTFTLPAGQATYITLSGGSNWYGCGYFTYKIYKE